MERIIDSNIDTDLYKLTMGQLVYHNFSAIGAGYEFINRGKTEFPDRFDIKLQDQVEMMAENKLQTTEKRFLETGCNGVLTPNYIDWYSGYQFNPDEVSIRRENGGLGINISGPWERTIYWEVPLMATISELYFKETGQEAKAGWQEKCIQKANTLEKNHASVMEFGTRRRFSFDVQDTVVSLLKTYMPRYLLGTSNIKLAMEHKIPVKGTFAHELVMAMAGIFGPEIANPATLSLWNKEYQGKLPVALTDTLTTEVFLQTFKGRAAEDYKTLRQDSGSPERWTDMVIDHFKQIGIDPLTRTALYSDGLDIQRVLEILRYNEGKINSAFGIGTNLTNDVGVRPLNMVIKLHFIVLENGQRVGVCKLSDDLGKISGDTQAIKDTLRVLGLTLPGGNR